MPFDRVRFPRGFECIPGGAPGSLDEIVALDASFTPVEGPQRLIFPIDSYVKFRGWGLVPVHGNRHELPLAVVLTIGDTNARLHAKPGSPRDDVARSFDDMSLVGAGFTGVAAIEELPLGHHKLRLNFVSRGREAYYTHDVPRSMEIVESRYKYPQLPESDRTTIAIGKLDSMHATAQAFENRFSVGEILTLRGDAVDRDTNVPASRVFAIVDEERYFGGVVGLPNENGERRGFNVRIPTRSFGPGVHALRVAAIASDGTTCSVARPLTFFLSRA